MTRRRAMASAHNRERWLVSYADFVTLLFAFFVVMFASAQVDKRKVGNLAMAIQTAFQRLGMFTPSTDQVNVLQTPEPFSSAQLIDSPVRTEDLKRIVPTPGKELASAQPASAPDTILRDLHAALADQINMQRASLHVTPEGLVISLREAGFFDSGSATLKSGILPTMNKLALILVPRAETLRVEGHTDNIPIHNAQFKSNWELSAARATEMVALFITQYGMRPERLSAAGYAEYHPIAPNETADGRGQNRRVDIVVLNPRFWGALTETAVAKHP